MTTDLELRNEYDEYDDYAAPDELDGGQYQPYRSLSKAAVLSLITAVLSLTAFIFPALLVASVLAVMLGFAGLASLRKYPKELTGRAAAVAGIVVGAITLVGGTAWHSYIYVTEVPEGYTRISFDDLQPRHDESVPAGVPALPMELDGKRVFVKGYIHPSVSDTGEIRKFILVPDMGTCCFGGQPKLTNMIEVNVRGDHGLHYALRKRSLAGTLHVSYKLKKVVGGLEGGYYELDADLAR